MNHDYVHCLDYTEDCPEECFRAMLVRDLQKINPVIWLFLCILIMERRYCMTKLEDFVKALEAINNFCVKSEHCNRGCPIHDYCSNVPTCESFQGTIKSVTECMKIIGSEEKHDPNKTV